ncbi:unnamed protein product [Lactuca virosa]|uniref:Uncharacterized protein n=1 Tax=Lactuca virosa TaxID=75947 RepID=A0AAU9PRW9_9ASTR|nr:unnamed protein product [Lactuca virosa]
MKKNPNWQPHVDVRAVGFLSHRRGRRRKRTSRKTFLQPKILVEVIDNGGGCRNNVQEKGFAKNESTGLVEPSKTNYPVLSSNKSLPKNNNSELSQLQNLSSTIKESEDKTQPQTDTCQCWC